MGKKNVVQNTVCVQFQRAAQRVRVRVRCMHTEQRHLHARATSQRKRSKQDDDDDRVQPCATSIAQLSPNEATYVMRPREQNSFFFFFLQQFDLRWGSVERDSSRCF